MSKASITIVGRLARDPETRTTASGTPITRLTIPTDSGWGENKTTTWWTCTLFGKSAEAAARHLHKGKWVGAIGTASVRAYDKKDGTKGYSPEVEVRDWFFVGSKSDNAGGGGNSGGYGGQSGGSTGGQTSGKPGGGAGFADDDIPF